MSEDKLPILYDVVIEGIGYDILVDWGNTPGWLETYADHLDQATRISLKPKEGARLPIVTVKLGLGRRWILFRRVFGIASGGGGQQVPVYAIGWQQLVQGVNIKSIAWIYPSGAVEVADDNPTFWKNFL